MDIGPLIQVEKSESNAALHPFFSLYPHHHAHDSTWSQLRIRLIPTRLIRAP